MPRTKALGAAARQEELNHLGDLMVAEVIAIYKNREQATDQAAADRLGWDVGRIKRLRQDPGRVRLRDVRAAVQSMGVTAEQWLRIGGLVP